MTDQPIQHAESVAVSKADIVAFIRAVDDVAQYDPSTWRIRNRLLKAAHSDGDA